MIYLTLEQTALILKLEDDWRDVNYCKAVYLPHVLQKESDKKYFFMPSTTNGKLI
jgi:hypothetical protein